jgi:hypothetical protein
VSRERIQAYKRVLRSWQRAGMSDDVIADTIGGLDSGSDALDLDIALGGAAAADPRMTRQMDEAPGTGIPKRL